MADLGNQKIKDTYQLVLQTDTSGNLQNLSGGTPYPLILNSGFTSNSDISGTTDLYIGQNIYSGTTNLVDIFATSAITNQNVYWSANTDGSITPSGLTTTVQTEGDLRVSGTVYTTNIQTTGSTSADTLNIEAGSINIRNRDGVTEYLKVAPDGFTFYLNDTVAVQFNDGSQKYIFDGRPGSETDWYTFNFAGDNGYDVMLLDPEWEVARFRKHVAIGDTYATWSNLSAIEYGLFVSGSSLFYSGGTSSISGNAITAVGDISGTTDLYIDGTISATTLIGAHTNADSAVQPADTFYIGTTSIAHNRGSAGLTLAGITLTTPDIGTPSAGVLTNCTALPAAQVAQGTMVSGMVLVAPALGTPASGVLTNTTGYPGDSSLVTVGTVTTGTWASNRKFELPNPSVTADGEGDIVYFGGDIDTTPGAIYFYNADRVWEITDANEVSTSTGLLAVALGDVSSEMGMLIKGMVTLDTNPGGTSLPIYLSETPGRASVTAPITSGAIVRVLGYTLNEDTSEVWFDPDKTWVELS